MGSFRSVTRMRAGDAIGAGKPAPVPCRCEARSGEHQGVPKLVQEFRGFLVQGNLIALAIAFVIGAAFAALMGAFVADLVTPIVAALVGEPSFDDLSFTINDSEFRYGHFLNALITFLSIAAAVFFFVLKPAERFGLVPAAPEMKNCSECTTEIPAAARRCLHCTAAQPVS
jgi:large conductance mechanosensitive channel